MQVYVDALGPSVPYQKYLSSIFPTMAITVCPSVRVLVSATYIFD